jgi:hypothetical protein
MHDATTRPGAGLRDSCARLEEAARKKRYMPGRLTKQSFLNSVDCPRLGWFSRLETPPVELAPERGTVADRLRGDEDQDIRERARSLFLDAPLVSRHAYDAACGQTLDLLDRATTSAVLEPAFGTATCRARADALVRTGDSWYLYKVNAGTSYTDKTIDELAYEWMVIDAAGVNLSGASVLPVSGDYRAGMPDRALFTAPVDVTARVAELATEFEQELTTINALTRAAEPPAALLIPHCRRCPLFRSCTGAGVAHHILELPVLTAGQLRRFLNRGYRALTDLPDSTVLTKRQQTVWQSVSSERPLITGDLLGHLNAVEWPAYYLDLETVGTAFPVFPGVAPFEQVPFLYSLRTCDQPGRLRSHNAFLSPHEERGDRQLAERLLQDAGTAGSIVVYSLYQARVIRGMKSRCPDLAAALDGLLRRTVTLESIIRSDFYHPDFRGRTCLRNVAPALVPGFTYIDLEIEDEASASASYAYLAKGDYYSSARAPLVRRDLFTYCARDTLALVRVHEALWRLAQTG